MAFTCGFFNAVDDDRLYNADQMSSIFDGLITQGIFESIGDKMAVTASNGMAVDINTGRGWFGEKWVLNDSVMTLPIAEADVTLNRYDAVCIKVDLSDSVRNAYPYIKQGTLATTPTKPAMERSEMVKEYCLAYVYVKAGATTITASDITDTRPNRSLCGWVTGLIEQVDTDTLWTQWDSQFKDFMADQNENAADMDTTFKDFMNLKQTEFSVWFDAIKGVLDEDASTEIAGDIVALQDQLKKVIVTFDPLGWESQESGEYIQTITVPGVKADNEIIITPSEESKVAWIRQGVIATVQAVDSVTFSTYHPEDVEMTATIIIMNI